MAATRNRLPPDPAARLTDALRQRLSAWLGTATAGRRVAVGFSGGRDSVALLHALCSLRAQTGLLPHALHVHHGLSPGADAWVAFAENFCTALDVPLHIERVTVDRASGLGIEGAARVARYQAFAGCSADLLLLAHHRDDQAETLLFNLLRGAGVQGAAAMPALRRLPRQGRPDLPLGRPWLDIPRADIDRYIAASGLPHIEDSSNLDPSFSRNHLRHQILPALGVRYPHAAESLATAARRFGEAAGLLDELADLDLAVLSDGEALRWPGLAALAPARQANLVRRWWMQGGETAPPAAALHELLRQCRAAAPDKTVELRLGGHLLYRWRARLYRVPASLPLPAGTSRWDGTTPLPWGGATLEAQTTVGQGLQAVRLQGAVEVRPRQGGEALRLRAGGPNRPLRLLLQEAAVPPWQRTRLPLVWIDGELAAVPGVGVAAAFAALPDEAGVEIVWR